MTKPRLVTAIRLRTALVLAALGGCDFGSDSSIALENDCASTSDCGDAVCVEGVCIDGSSSAVEVIVEVLRGASDTQRPTPASWAFAPQSFAQLSDRNFALPATREVMGVVRWKGARVPASLRFTRRMGELVSALTPVTVEVDTFREESTADGVGEVDYTTVLVAGQTYDVTVLPSSDVIQALDEASMAVRTLPPIHTSVALDDTVDAAPFRFDINFADSLDVECADGQLAGCTLTGAVLSFDGETEEPASGLQVRAVEKDTGEVVSSIAETDELGNFAIRVSEVAAAYDIRVTSTATSIPPLPSVTIDPVLAFLDDPINKRIYIPRVETVQFTGSVRDGDGRPVEGASVRFSSSGIFEQSELGLEGSFKSSTATNDEGRFSLKLLPGLYTVVVTPPDDVENTWAPTSREAFVAPEAADLGQVVLPSQIALSGSCTTFRGEPANGVTIAARARGDRGELQRSQETVSSLDGDFRMNMDAGRYDMSIKVPDSTGFPWLVESELVMSRERGTVTRDYMLPPPIVVRGSVLSADGFRIGGAKLRAYVLEGPPGEARAIQVAETVSDQDGFYRLLISPSLDAR